MKSECSGDSANLKIAFLSYGYGKDQLGIGRASWHLIHELRKMHVDVDVFTTQSRLKSFGPLIFYLRNAFLNLKKYDVVHSNEGAGLLINHPCTIETYHHDYRQAYDVNSLLFSKLENILCRKARHIIAPSFRTKESLRRNGFYEKTSVIYHGVDNSLFRKTEGSKNLLRQIYGIDRDSFVVISVGQLIARKKHIDIVKALKGRTDIVFVLVGKGPEEVRIKQMARSNGVGLVHFKAISDETLVQLYNLADVYVHTAVMEGFGLTILEAMACGLPIIAYETADFAKVIKSSGILLKPGDFLGLRRSVNCLKSNLQSRHDLSRAAQQESKRYTWKKAAEEHLKIYKRVCC